VSQKLSEELDSAIAKSENAIEKGLTLSKDEINEIDKIFINALNTKSTKELNKKIQLLVNNYKKLERNIDKRKKILNKIEKLKIKLENTQNSGK
jgi:hypothetical protein